MNSNVTNILALKAPAKREAPRSSGLPCAGPLHWGAHVCLLYASQDELLETVVPYIREGLLSNEYCLWIVSQTLTVEQAAKALRAQLPVLDHYLASGQLEILDYTEWYTKDGGFDAARVSQGWFDKMHLALERGFDGMRLSADTFWLAEGDWETFMQYEARLDPVLKEQRIIALCTYSMEKLRKQELFDVVSNHEFAIVRERGAWTTFKSSARDRNEQFIRESEALLRATIDGASDGIVTCDATGGVVLANLAAQCMFNCPPFELVGANIGDFVPDLATALHGQDELRPHTSFSGEARRKDGAVFPVEWTLNVVTADNQPLFVGFVRDLTQQRAAEAQIRKLHADRVNAIGGMATALAHELNQPLTAATSYLQAAQRLLRMPKDERPARVEDAVDRAAEQALRAGKIISHIREFVSRREPDKTIWSLHDLIHDACMLTKQSARQVGVDLKCDLLAEKPLVIADRIQIEQVLVNLIRNAVEAVQSADVRVVTIATLSAGDAVQVDVVDTGGGFPEEIKAELFEPFVTSKAHGLGVGLSVSRAIIEAHDGRIWAQPNPAGGSIVSFTLPLIEMD